MKGRSVDHAERHGGVMPPCCDRLARKRFIARLCVSGISAVRLGAAILAVVIPSFARDLLLPTNNRSLAVLGMTR
jgi:hypothetical protein